MRKTLYAALALSALLLATQTQAASVVTADHKGGYSAYVMGEVLPFWTAPQGKTKGPTHVLLEIGGQGELEACRVMTSSGSSRADKAACASAESAAPFLAPPHNFPIDVYMSFWTGKAVATAKKADKKKSTQEKAKKTEPATDTAAKSQADARAEQERIIEEAQKPVDSAETAGATAAKNETGATTGAKKAPADASKKASTTEQPSRTYAGIDYSRPRSTPAGLAPLGDLVGAKLPEPKDEEIVAPIAQDEPKEETSKPAKPTDTSATTNKSSSKDFVITIEPAPLEDKSPAEEAKEEDEDITPEPVAYPKGKEPFIQENRKGQVMDDEDFYVEQVIRKIRPLVKYPLQMKPGIVSTSVNMYINGAGTVQRVELSSSSNNSALDAALVEASQKITQLPPHPSGKAQELYLIFMVETPKP